MNRIHSIELPQNDDYDFAAVQEAEAILSGEIESTPETLAMVKEWYGSDLVKAGFDYVYQAGRYAKALELAIEAQEAVIGSQTS